MMLKKIIILKMIGTSQNLLKNALFLLKGLL